MAEQDGTTPTRIAGVLAQFDTPDALVAAARKVREAGFKSFDAHSPYPLHDVDEAMGIRRTILPVLVFMGGLTGLCTAIAMQWWMNGIDYAYVISGKPLLSTPAWVPIMFELTVLFAALTTFFGVFILNSLPAPYHWTFGSSRFKAVTDASFFISIDAADKRFDKDGTPKFLDELGATAVEVTEEAARHAGTPKALTYAVIALVIASWIPLALAGAKRHLKSGLPPIHLFPDMDFQPKFKAQRTNAFFDDQRSMRLPIEGTIAVGQVYVPTERTTGRFDGTEEGAWIRDYPHGVKLTDDFPDRVKLTDELMARGQDRFDIYCSPCHGVAGDGQGMVRKRVETRGDQWAPPTDLRQDSVVQQPIGQMFDSISNGVRQMPGYASQIPVDDRWAIIAYVRALGRSQQSTAD